MVRPKYNSETEEFVGLYQTIGLIVIRGDAEEVFFNYGYDKEKSKVLCSHYRRRIPNAFCGTMFNRHRMAVESGELESDRSCLFFFCPSVTDRSEEINQCLKNVSITPVDVELKKLNEWVDNG